MKIKSMAAAAIAAAMLLTGCSDDFESVPESQGSSSSSSKQPSGENSVIDDGNTYTNGATLLSMKDGGLSISRRNEKGGNSGGSGWTLLVYLCGTDLESEGGAASADINEMMDASATDDVHIVFQTGGTNEWNSSISNGSIQRYALENGDVNLVDEVADANMGDPQTLSDFVSWGLENYPAENVGLVFWNHGGGSINGVCFDEKNDNDSLSLREIDAALNSVYGKMQKKFEFIGFDACLMSTLETANILVPYANYMFASEEVEPGGGWNYMDIVNYLSENPSANGAQLGEMQCESYYRHCVDNGDAEVATFAITDLSKLDELLISFDKTSRELYESEKFTDIARAVSKAENFGGNNRSEGYTNMVDLKGLLNAVSAYAPSASETLGKLENAIISQSSGSQHPTAGGLSLYYPLSVQGSTELSTFAGICTSSWYLALVDKIAYGTSGNDIFGYDNSHITNDCENIWGDDYSASGDVGVDCGFGQIDNNSTIGIKSVYIDDNGKYTVELSDTEQLNYMTCSLFWEYEGASLYLGEDDDVNVEDIDSGIIHDNFEGQWVSLDGYPIMIELVSKTDNVSVYTSPINLNGKRTNLRLLYDWATYSWAVMGVWGGIDGQTGAAGRETVKIKDGDVITPLYLAVTEEANNYIEGVNYTVNGDIPVDYSPLGDGFFSFSMVLYDVYGNYYYTPAISVVIDVNGEVYFDVPAE